MKDLIQYKGYYGSVHFDQENLILYGKVEFVRALISYEATNAKALKKAFEEAVNDYLALCKSEKIQPELPFKGSLNIRLGSELHRSIALEASYQKLSINKFITKALMDAVHAH
jgi:predicted HicB family RNase H-like nuclease